DVVLMAAAVADFRPVNPMASKWAKAAGPPEILLEPTTDILATLAARRRPGQVLVGFAAATGSLAASARAKLVGKGVDLVVANDVGAGGSGFGHDTNRVLLVSAGGDHDVPLMGKRDVARLVLDAVVPLLRSHTREERDQP
ncbi:MAG: phosphopantothenoylcysteine decarboxylase, partial [Acidimicrobiales bacterium]